MRRVMLILACLIGLSVGSIGNLTAQDGVTAVITSPEPVSLLRGLVTFTGTANAENQTGYSIQWRQLNDDLEPLNGENGFWSPAVLPQNRRVLEAELGTWNTTLVADGVFELELIVNLNDGETERYLLSPVRVENEISPYKGGRFVPHELNPSGRGALFRDFGGVASGPSIAPQDVLATATALVETNVRMGDGRDYRRVATLDPGVTVPVIGISGNSGWFLVMLPSGSDGFVSPNTVRVDGDLTQLAQINVPLPTAAPTLYPTPGQFFPRVRITATPSSSANLVFTRLEFRETPKCDNQFELYTTVQNAGLSATGSGFTITATDRHIATGTVTRVSSVNVGQLGVGQSVEVAIPLRIDTYFDERHRVDLLLDSNGNVPELSESDNTLSTEYTLSTGDCGD